MRIHLYPTSGRAIVIGGNADEFPADVADKVAAWLAGDTERRVLGFSDSIDVVVHDG